MTHPRLTGAICFMLLAATLSAQSGKSQHSDLAARVQLLEDKAEIQNLLTNYGRMLDAKDFAGYGSLFAKDGEWVGGFGTVRTPPGIQAFMEKNIGPNGKGATYHLLSNFIIDVQGDTATAWSRWAFMVGGADGKPIAAQGGHYEDALVRENGHWKFKRRMAFTDIPHFDPTEKK